MAFRLLIFILLCTLASGRLAAASLSADKLNGLLNNSPFGASRANSAAGTGTGDPLEFRAVLEEGGKQFYSIYEAATKRSTWMELNDPVNGLSVKGYDAAHDTVTVDFRGKSMSLAIKRAAPVAQVAMLPGGAGPGNQVSPGGNASIDQQRLQQVQEEIRRRRALRQQPTAPGNAPGAGSGPQPMPLNSGEVPSGPQPLPANPANNLSGPPLPVTAPGVQSGGPQPLPLPAKP